MKQQKGFSIVELIIILAVLGAIGFVGWKVLGNKDKDTSQSTTNSSQSSEEEAEEIVSDVTWMWGGDKWLSQNGTPPDCGDKPVFDMPVDIDKVSSVLYPGQQRSTGYKAHGGFQFADAVDNKVDVTIPVNSHLIKASRYIEMGEVQYFLVFSVPCGYAYRFDHILTLTPEFQAIIDKLPEAKVDDSRTTPIQPPIAFKKGTKVATAVGFKGTTAGMDFGVYDLRQPNAASKEAAFASKHEQYKEFVFYGVCFLDGYMGEANSAKLKALPATDQASGKTSDYCD